MTLTLERLPDEDYGAWREGVAQRRAAGPRLRVLGDDELALTTARQQLDGFLPAAGPPEGTEVLTVAVGGRRVGTVLLVVQPSTAQLADLVLDDPAAAAELRELVVARLRAAGARSLRVSVVTGDPATEAFVATDGFEVVATQMQLDLTVDRRDDQAGRIRTRPMTAEELDAYFEHAVEEFAEETMAADPLLEREEALSSSRQMHAEILPQGVQTPGHDFLVGLDAADGRRVGFIWLFHEGRSGFVYDVVVDEAERGRGYGRALMDTAAAHHRALGLRVLGLNVFGHNPVARTLYDRLGYDVVDEVVHLRLVGSGSPAPADGPDADREAIAAVVRTFFAAFTSGPGCDERLDALPELFIPEAVIVRTCGQPPTAYDVRGFIAPRRALLTGGRVTDFREWPLEGRTELFGDIAHHFCRYAKEWREGDTTHSGRGMKTIQLVRTADGWRISAAAWDDERDGLALEG